ncbi:uncharacterized protein EKO05_0008699 [Ascochyta rabiei]|uniref:Uncharacterized protein n=1 Tax=Didymella rabiei TaxID=5454 RepID=A0A163FYZ8_DIDRA|nr:uncharacterized protein EKO05_0008699 [Ascochyta rabiei]KZM24603.1 hypothetical protein ST47_g4228 [Ascochyta rabiei]UPX18397.1 hypothetical protein EKO05_0008699 [Ascochyta rabiei]
MRFATLSVLTALFAATTMAVAPQRSVIISFPNETPDHIVEEAKEGIRKAKGVITHEYNIIKGFAAHAPASALEFVTAMGEQYKVEIEEDGIVTTQGEE